MRGGRDENITASRHHVLGKAVEYRYIPMKSYAHASCPILPLIGLHLDLCAPISGCRKSLYCVFTSPSASTLTCSLDERVVTTSSGISALRCVSITAGSLGVETRT